MVNGSNLFTPPYWFTLEFFSTVIAEKSFRNLVESRIKYLLIHPADFANNSDLLFFSDLGQHSIERMNSKTETYTRLFEQRVNTLLDNGHKFVTMKELALYHKLNQ